MRPLDAPPEVEAGSPSGLHLFAFAPESLPEPNPLLLEPPPVGDRWISNEEHAAAKAAVQALFHDPKASGAYAAAMDRWKTIDKTFYRQQAFLRAEEERLRREAALALPKRTGPVAKRFTTDYGIEWGRRQPCADGRPWVLIDRERFDHLTKRHHDLELGVDAIFDDGEGRVGIQAAGVGERSAHYQRFVERGGVEKAQRRRTRVVYLEFLRGNKTPVREETWAQRP